MQTAIFAVIILLVIIIVLQLVFRPGQGNEAALFNYRLNNLQSGLREEFRLSRTESAAISRENRTELNDTLKDFKEAFTQTLGLMLQQNQQTLQQLGKTAEDSNRANRESLATSLKDFITEQKTKFDELRTGQTVLSEKTIEQLEKISTHIETRLAVLTQREDRKNTGASQKPRDDIDSSAMI